MSNGDATRKSHIKRIYKDDDPDSGQWIDVERLDELSFKTGRAYQFRRKVWKFNWDDFNPGSPTVTKKKIYDPNDEENFIEVPVRKSVLVKEGRGDQFQGNRHHFVNDASNKTRKTLSRRVYHHEIKEGYLEDGEPPSDPEQYLDSLGDQDMGQYVEVELLDQYWTDQNEGRDAQGRPKKGAWQEKKWRLTEADPLLQEPMLEDDEVDPEFVPVKNPEEGPKVDPPWRLDPLQNIVNVQWAGGSIAVTGTQREGFSGEFSFIYRCKMSKGTTEPEWKEVAKYTPSSEEGMFGFRIGIGAMIYASVGADEDGKGGNPTFVVGGRWDSALGAARICMSHDGETWADVYTGPQGEVYGVCWDENEKAFYAAMLDDSEFAEWGADFNNYDVLLKSPEGTSWSEVYRAQVGGYASGHSGPSFVLPPGYSNPIIDHGGDKVMDVGGRFVTNAFWGYNEATDTLIYPDPPPNYWVGGSPGGLGSSGGTILKIDRGGEITTVALEMELIWAVTFAAGIWQACGEMVGVAGAGGSGVIATSVDDGDTWETTHTVGAGSPFRSIASGPTTDF